MFSTQKNECFMIDFVHLILQNEKGAKYCTLSNGYYAHEEYTWSATEGRL